MQKNYLKRMPKSVHSPIQAILNTTQREAENIDKQLDKLLDSLPEYRKKRVLLSSAKGADKALTFTLMCELSELGSLNQKQVAVLVGGTSMIRDSRNSQGKR